MFLILDVYLIYFSVSGSFANKLCLYQLRMRNWGKWINRWKTEARKLKRWSENKNGACSEGVGMTRIENLNQPSSSNRRFALIVRIPNRLHPILSPNNVWPFYFLVFQSVPLVSRAHETPSCPPRLCCLWTPDATKTFAYLIVACWSGFNGASEAKLRLR